MPTGVYIRKGEYLKKLRRLAIVASTKSANLRRGIPLSDEHRKKISNAFEYEKYNPISKGIRISKALTGRKLSLEARLNMSIAMKGRKANYISPESRKRGGIKRRGEKHWRWKGGKTELVKQIKNLTEYKVWRTSVFQRDNYKCVRCLNGSVWVKKLKSGNLNVDHIKPFSVILDENKILTQNDARICLELWNINNGRTLCKECHKKTDTYGGRINKK